MKVLNYSGVTDGYVLTKTTTNGSDDVVWSAPSEGGGLPDESKLIGKSYNWTDPGTEPIVPLNPLNLPPIYN